MAEKKLKKAPEFKSLEEERAFWDTHDTTGYFDYDHDILVTGGPKSAVLNIRIEPRVKAQLEHYARLNGVDVPDLVREWIYTGVEKEIARHYPDSTVAVDDRDAELLVLLRLMESLLARPTLESDGTATPLREDGAMLVKSDEDRYTTLRRKAASVDAERIIGDVKARLRSTDFGTTRRSRH